LRKALCRGARDLARRIQNHHLAVHPAEYTPEPG
jgi:hypothetical protein